MHEVAARRGVPVFRRYAIMRALGPDARDAQLAPDGLHPNDLGYRCLAEQLSAAITPPRAPADVPVPGLARQPDR
jgi:lysophospholipase L1-like esterase